MVILYGSETGNSQEFAKLLARRCEYLRFATIVMAMDEFDVKALLDYSVLTIICSTTGQGELPRNAQKFWKFMLRKKLPNDLLNHLNFTTFGLGDSSYPKFNYAIKKIHKRLLQLGAVEISNRAESDEQSPEGVEGFYQQWETTLIANLLEKFPLPQGVTEIPRDTLLPPKQKVVVDLKGEKQTVTPTDSICRQYPGLLKGKISGIDRITSTDHFQDVERYEISSESSLEFMPGDVLALYPANDPKDVEALISCQEWQDIADLPLTIEGDLLPVEGGIISKLTLRSLLTYHLDIMSIPRVSFFMNCWHFAKDEREMTKLRDFSQMDQLQELYDYANRPRRSISETIQEFFSLRIPVEYLLEIIPTIKPRLFSISSKPDQSKVELTVAIVEYKTMLRRIRKGLCTKWLKQLSVGDDIVFTIHRQNLVIGSPQITQPIIMISPGTGIAPMKSIIETKLAQFEDPSLYLFTGNRYKDKDYLYGDMWESLKASNKIKLFNSFSRQNGGYVQDRLYHEKDLVNDLVMNQNAIIYVCGSSGKMPTQVRITLETIFEECNGDMNEQDAKSLLLKLEDSGRYIQETW